MRAPADVSRPGRAVNRAGAEAIPGRGGGGGVGGRRRGLGGGGGGRGAGAGGGGGGGIGSAARRGAGVAGEDGPISATRSWTLFRFRERKLPVLGLFGT
jgi:hypothetical protein